MLETEKLFKSINIDRMKGIAPSKQTLLNRLGLVTVYDLIFNLPFRFEDHTYIQPLSDLLDEEIFLDYPCNILFYVTCDEPDISPKNITTYTAEDVSGTGFDLVYFNCPDFIHSALSSGVWSMAFGKVSINPYSERLTMIHPEIIPIDSDEIRLPNNLSPVYHLTRGLRREFVQSVTNRALLLLANKPIEELIPPTLNPFHLTLTEALLISHNPPPSILHQNFRLEELPSFRRICFEELVAYKLAMMMVRQHQNHKTPQNIPFNTQAHEAFLASLPFEPTNAQSTAFQEIMHDCNQEQAMSRILNGDVGSGKTLVAAMCMMQCAVADKQAVLIAPTEILAQQHYQKLQQLFAPFNIEICLLTGAIKKKEKKELGLKCSSGQIKLIVGTHAVFQDSVQYHSLALVIFDEQHRFGVGEREKLLEKAPEGFAVNELLMTATPIPRSLRLALFNETNVSILNEMPKGRLPIITTMLEACEYPKLIERVRLRCEAGDQAFWICPYVDEVENVEVTSVKERVTDLKQKLPSLSVGLIHGKMSEKEKNTMMTEFAAGKYHVLVATVIVEVGVDVPNASIIVIEDAQVMGLAQLHQLRGRVGRGTKQSYCVLMYRNPSEDKPLKSSKQSEKRQKAKTNITIGLELANSATDYIQDEFSDDTVDNAADRANDIMDWKNDVELNKKLESILDQAETPINMKRLQILECTNNGFAIASQDLILRGPGEFFGDNQTGNETFRYADLIRDHRMLKKVNKVSEWMLENKPLISDALVSRWYPQFNEDIDEDGKQQDNKQDTATTPEHQTDLIEQALQLEQPSETGAALDNEPDVVTSDHQMWGLSADVEGDDSDEELRSVPGVTVKGDTIIIEIGAEVDQDKQEPDAVESQSEEQSFVSADLQADSSADSNTEQQVAMVENLADSTSETATTSGETTESATYQQAENSAELPAENSVNTDSSTENKESAQTTESEASSESTNKETN